MAAPRLSTDQGLVARLIFAARRERRDDDEAIRLDGAASAIIVLAALAPRPAAADDVTLTVWSHEADEPAKVAFRELAARNLESSPASTSRSPGTKGGLCGAEDGAAAGQGPSVLSRADQTEYIANGYIVALDDLVDWSRSMTGPGRSGP